MALLFGGATTDRVEIAPASSINDMSKVTVLVWVKVSTLTTNRRIWSKQPPGFNRFFGLSGTAGDMNLNIRRTGGALSYTTNSTPLSATGVWKCVAFTYDDSLAVSAAHIYTGGLSTALVEATYGTATNGTGSSDASDSTNPMMWGNQGTANALPGAIALGLVWNRVLTLSELQSQQFHPVPTSGCVVYSQLGFNGTSSQPDLSGNANAGTVTGAAVADHVPLGPPFGFDDGAAYYVTPSSFLAAWAARQPVVGVGVY